MERKSTTPGWVSPVQVQAEPTQVGRAPTHKGEISGWRTGVFFILAIIVATAVGTLAYMAFGIVPALLVFVLALLLTFTPFYVWDASVSSGYAHRRMELRAEDYKSQDAVAIATAAATVNNEQQEQITQLWKANKLFDERLKAVETYRIQDRKGVRDIPRQDEFDMAIDSWLAQFMFDANGVLVGSHPAGHLKRAFPFTAKDERGRQCFARLTAAGLIGKSGNNYTWTGPQTLTETQQRLAPGRGRMVPEVE